MKRQTLTRAIVLGLLLAGTHNFMWGGTSIGYAGFNISEDGKSIEFDKGVCISGKIGPQYNGKYLSDFDTVIFNVKSDVQRGFALDFLTAQGVDYSNTDFVIMMNGTGMNSDGIHFRNWSNNVTIKNLDATINTPNSDAVNIGHESTSSTFTIKGNLNAIVTNGNGIRANAPAENGSSTSTINVLGGASIKITADKVEGYKVGSFISTSYSPAGIYAGNSHRTQTDGDGIVNMFGNTYICTEGKGNTGVLAGKNGTVNLNNVTVEAHGNNSKGIAAENKNLTLGFLDSSSNRTGSTITLNGNTNNIFMNGDDSDAIYAESEYGIVKSGENGIGSLYAKGDITAEKQGTIKLDIKEKTNGVDNTDGSLNMLGCINSLKNGNIEISSKNNVIVNDADANIVSDAEKVIYGSKRAINVEDGGKVILSAEANNSIHGGVYAMGKDKDYSSINIASDGNNIIYSSAQGKGYDGEDIVSAVYASRGADVIVRGGQNIVETKFQSETAVSGENEYERVIWSQQGGKITFDGATVIRASRANSNAAGNSYYGNSFGLAITAGSEKILYDEETGEIIQPEKNSLVTVNYDGANGKEKINYISGDIVSGYNGSVSVAGKSDTDNIVIDGNLLAANGGTINVSLGQGGYLTGRIDDYIVDDNTHAEFYNPVFSNEIVSGGDITLHMGKGSKWDVTGQSWLTNLDMDGAVIDISPDVTFNQNSQALTIRNIKVGSTGTFVMDLNHENHTVSDMLYIGVVDNSDASVLDGTVAIGANFDVVLKGELENWQNLSNEELRFATVLDDKITFDSVTMRDEGINNIEFDVGSEEYSLQDKENEEYNGDELSPVKPGNEVIGDAVEGENAKNWFIKGVKGQTESDTGKTIINMSRANYSNAVYMDRLNKRMGEMRYVTEDEGLWVRIRHDRIGKEDSFRSKNTMYEIGYDHKQVNDGGERRLGIAMDYMDGSTEYSDVAGKGKIKRNGLWLYDTWMGDKGHYADYVVKWGHLDNEFDILTMSKGEKVTGDYTNDVFSISAEYGKKNDVGNGWYFEPQAQLQYARVTDADYRTSQNSEVELDSIDSLIARAGFRLGRDLDENSSVYIKADVLHEFLGDQTIYAKDGTGVMDKTYKNEGTWYDVGFGFAVATSKNSYAYVDFEKYFGNGNDETYQINTGMNWSF